MDRDLGHKDLGHRGKLVLTRRQGQSIFVGQAKLTVVSIERGRVRLAFEAPSDIKIWREELLAGIDHRGDKEGWKR